MTLTSTKMGLHEWAYSNNYNAAQRQKMQHVDLQVRFQNMSTEVEKGFTAEQTLAEVERCLNCDIETHFIDSLSSSATRVSTSVRWIAWPSPPVAIWSNSWTTAESVTANSRTAYAKAMALQRFLRGPDFTYSLESPVQGGYDGNGLSVLADFLTQKSGDRIHFASAMAVMARLEGIPSRIAVGYAPGRQTGATVSVAGQGGASGVRSRRP